MEQNFKNGYNFFENIFECNVKKNNTQILLR